MDIKCAHTEVVPIEQLVPNPRNPNKHPELQIRMLAKIMNHSGWRSPIVVSNRSGFIVKGHGRLEAAALNKWEEVPVDRQDYESEAAEYADMVADNIIADLAETDLGMVLEDAQALGIDDSELLGLTDFEITPLKEVDNSTEELNLGEFDNFAHECPKCGFEWNDNGTT